MDSPETELKQAACKAPFFSQYRSSNMLITSQQKCKEIQNNDQPKLMIYLRIEKSKLPDSSRYCVVVKLNCCCKYWIKKNPSQRWNLKGARSINSKDQSAIVHPQQKNNLGKRLTFFVWPKMYASPLTVLHIKWKIMRD